MPQDHTTTSMMRSNQSSNITIGGTSISSYYPENIELDTVHDHSVKGLLKTVSHKDIGDINHHGRKIRSTIMGIYVGVLTAIGGFLYGYDTGVINSLLEMKYVKEHFSQNGENFTAKESSILTSVLSLGTLIGSLFSPVISDKFGRKFSIIVATGVFFVTSTVVQLCSYNYTMLVCGRIINGIGVGILSSVVPLYQAEISPKWIRGSIISFYQWAITWGLLVSSAISQGTRSLDDPRCFRIPIALQLVWSLILFFGVISIPESPRFYVMNGDLDNAIVSLSKLRRLKIKDIELIEELIEIKASYDYEISEGKPSYFDVFTNSKSRTKQVNRILTCIALQTFQQASGINFIFYYGVDFFVATGVDNSYLMSLITYLVNVIFTVPGILFVDKIGRRKLLIIGAIGMSLSNYIIAIVGSITDSVEVNKVMIAFVCLFIAFFASSWGPVVWILTVEMFSLSIRQKSVSILAAINWVVNFVFAFCTPYLIDEGSHTAALGTKIFFLWGSLNFLGFTLTYFFVYETKGLMLEDINELYNVCSVAYKSEKENKKIREANELKEKTIEQEVDQRLQVQPESISDADNTSVQHEFSHAIDKSVMDYLNEWEAKQAEKRERDKILADNILQHNELPPEPLEPDDDGDENGDKYNGSSGDEGRAENGNENVGGDGDGDGHRSGDDGQREDALYFSDSLAGEDDFDDDYGIGHRFGIYGD